MDFSLERDLLVGLEGQKLNSSFRNEAIRYTQTTEDKELMERQKQGGEEGRKQMHSLHFGTILCRPLENKTK